MHYVIAAALLAMASIDATAGEAEWKTYSDQVVPHLTRGNGEQAELVARAALEEALKTFGGTHPNAATSYAHLALTLRFRGNNEEAEKNYRRALVLREKALGRAHPSTALLLGNVAEVIQALGRHAEAEKLYREALAVFEKAHGDDPKTATVLNNLGALLRAQARYKEAEPVLRRAIAMKEKTLGADSTSVAHTLTHLAEVLEQLGKKDEAENARKRAAAIKK